MTHHVELDEVISVELKLNELRSLGSLVPSEGPQTIEPLPKRPRNWLFIATVVVPVILSGFYLFAMAADRYKSEVRFIVRSTGSSGNVSLEGGMPGMGAAAGGLSHATSDAFVVNEYIVSRDAVDKLVREKGLREIIARPALDIFSRFPGVFSGSSKERLFEYYKTMVSSEVDDSTGISTVTITAFRPDDAQELARALLAYAETIVNRINDRANSDRVKFALKVVERAKEELTTAEKELTAFRTSSGVVDPKSEYKAALQNISRLSAEVSQREAALSQQIFLTPNGPAIASQREKVRSLRASIAEQNQELVGKSGSLAVKLGRFEQLMLNREIASKELGNAMISYEASLQTASEQQLYLQPIAEPNAPDLPFAPKRFLIMFIVIVCSFMAYATLKSMKDLAEEHAI